MKKFFQSRTFLQLLSVVLAFGLWIFVMYTEKPATEKEFKGIPVTFEGEYVLEENGLIIYEHEPLEIDVTLSGARTQIARVANEDITAKLSVSSLMRAGEYQVDNLKYDVAVAIEGVSVVSHTPSSSKIKIEKKLSVSVPVMIEETGSFSDENAVLSAEPFVDYITVTGPESIVGGISQALVEIDRSKVKSGEEVACIYSLIGTDGANYYGDENIETNFEFIKVTCNILYKREVAVYPVIIGSPNPSYAVESVSVIPETIMIKGEKSVVEALSIVETEPINIASINGSIPGLKVSYNFPQTVSALDEKDNSAVVGVKVVRSTMQQIPVTYLETTESQDQSRFVFNGELMVSVSGAPSNIEKAAITATIDISRLTAPGLYTVPVTITSSTGQYLTVLGTYTAEITILS